MDNEVSTERLTAAYRTSTGPATEVETAPIDSDGVTEDVTASGENNATGITSNDWQLTPSVDCGVAVSNESMIHLLKLRKKITLRV